MKALTLYFCLFLPFLALSQSLPDQSIRIPKLVVDSKKTYYLDQGDSTATIVIDTLVMANKARLYLVDKKKVKLVVNNATVGKDCVITGNDGKNNGTDLKMAVNFSQLQSLFIDVSGDDAKNGNRNFDNGNGGSVILNYLASGKKPQLTDKKSANYLSVKNRAGGYMVNPQTDIAVLVDQIKNGTAGRPLGNLPNGKVYSGNIGKDGTTSIQPVNSLN